MRPTYKPTGQSGMQPLGTCVNVPAKQALVLYVASSAVAEKPRDAARYLEMSLRVKKPRKFAKLSPYKYAHSLYTLTKHFPRFIC